MKSLRLFKTALWLAAVIYAGALLIPVSVLAVDNSGIGGKPANPRSDNPRSQSIFVHEASPGSQIEDAVQVINNTDKQKTLLVYAVDSQASSDGAFACAQKADTAVSVGTWINLAKDSVSLPPNSSENVPFTINVPETASAGEQNGCIVIQDSEQVPAPQGNGVTLSFRSAIRVAITVPGEITKELDFSGPIVINANSRNLKLSVGLKNNGNVSLDTEIETHIQDIFGRISGSAGGTFPVLSRSHAVFNFEVKKPFWGGWYRVSATAAYGTSTEQSLGESGEKSTITSPIKWVFVPPTAIALAIELVVLAALLLLASFLITRRRKYQKLHSSAIYHVVKKNQSLQSIATKYDVSWKVIAKLNKLKAPYHIEPGQELKIPKPQDSGSKDEKKVASK